MEERIAAFDARRQFGRVLQDVTVNGARYVVQRHGEPVAVVVPIEIYQQWKRGRADFFRRLRDVAERADLPEDEAERLAGEAVRAARRK